MERYQKYKTGDSLQLPIYDKTVNTELSGDFTLPDYQPEIKRLLRVHASVLPPSKYIGDRECYLAGNIDYFVLYTGSDNSLYLAPLTGEYKVNIPPVVADDEDDGYLSDLVASVVTVPDMISGRVTAPRKLSIKCRLRTRAQMFGEMPVEEELSKYGEGLQGLRRELDTTRFFSCISDTVKLSDEMIYDSRDEEMRVISADAKVLFGEVTPMNGSVSCRGDVYIKLLLCKDNENQPYTALRKLPIVTSIAIEGATVGDSASAKACVSEMNIEVDDGRIAIDVGVIVEAEVCHSGSVSYIKDVYSTERRTENSYKNIVVPSMATAFTGNFTLSDSLTLDEAGLAHGAKVIDVTGCAYPEDYIFDGERCTVGGKAKFMLLLEKDGEYSTADVELPFNYHALSEGGFCSAICCAEVISSRARIDGDRIGIDAEIGVCGRAVLEKNETMLARVGLGEEISRERGEYVICFPSDDDSLWDVAKRYGAPLDKIAEANGISRDIPADSHETVSGMNFLVV